MGKPVYFGSLAGDGKPSLLSKHRRYDCGKKKTVGGGWSWQTWPIHCDNIKSRLDWISRISLEINSGIIDRSSNKLSPQHKHSQPKILQSSVYPAKSERLWRPVKVARGISQTTAINWVYFWGRKASLYSAISSNSSNRHSALCKEYYWCVSIIQ